jgi:16S rRNA (guanine966-N2)-methyltransferase
MRIVGGAWRGRPLVAPAGRFTRPTSDKVREAIFDVLQALPEARLAGADGAAEQLAGHEVLDLYAGSGALGIEALSRGAASCTFVEHERSARAALHRNLAAVGVAGGSRGGGPSRGVTATRVVASSVTRALQADARAGCMYTLVLADPPYARSADAQDVLSRLLEPVLAPQAVIVVETSVKEDVVLPWRLVRVKTYGDTKVTFMVAD